MNNNQRTVGIIATVATALVCGCPGLASICWGAIAAFAANTPGANIDIGGSSDPRTATAVGLAALCVGLIALAIPFVVGFLTLRNRPQTPSASGPNEPIPPGL